MTSRFIPSHLLTYISRSPPPAQVAVLHKGIPVQETSPSLPLFAASFRIPITCTARTVPTRTEPPEPSPTAEDPTRDRRAIRFWGVSSRDCSLLYDYFLYVNYERTTTSSTTGLHCDHLSAST
jgi:hypothetical protein